MNTVDRYAVMGNPISHSKSPLIHSLFAAETGQILEYDAMEVPVDSFAAAVKHFFESGKGLNVTVPFKQQAWSLADQLSERAQLAGAVNTLWCNSQGELVGDNTDGCGLVTDLRENQGIELEGKRILVLGAGGAVRGVLQPLLAQQPDLLVIANRTPEKATELATLFAPQGNVKASSYEALDQDFDVVINGTSASLQGDVPAISASVINSKSCCYDMMYGARPTAFLKWAKTQGCTICIDGLGMLVEQAAESFFLWRGVRPKTTPVFDQLRAQLEAG